MVDSVLEVQNIKLPDSGGVTGADVFTSTGNVPTIASGVTFPAGHIIQVQSTNLSDTNNLAYDSLEINETTSYTSTSLLPLLETSITPINSNSYFYITLSGRFGISRGCRSKILLSKNWAGAGTNAYSDGDYIWFTAYGLYNDTSSYNETGFLYNPGQYAYIDKHQDHTVGVQRTYSWFGGAITAGSTQRYVALNMVVMEIMV